MKGTNAIIPCDEEMRAWCQEVLDKRYGEDRYSPFTAEVTNVQSIDDGGFLISLRGRIPESTAKDDD